MTHHYFLRIGILFAAACLLLVTACSEGEEAARPVEAPLDDPRVVEAPAAVDNTPDRGEPAAEPVYYDLTYLAAAGGSLAGQASQQVAHGSAGSQVMAMAADGYHFVAWSDGVKNAARIDEAVVASLTVTALFAADQYRLTYAAGENGSISGASSQRVAHGNTGSAVTAVPASGYHFTGWSDGGREAQRIDRDVMADLEVTAHFAVNRYQLTYSPGEEGTLEREGVQSVPHGADAAPVRAIAARGYHFVDWSDGVATAERTDRQVNADLQVSARFAPDTYAVAGSVDGLVEGTRLLLRNNAGDDLEISANGVFRFASELPDGAPYAVVVLAQPEMPNQTCTVSAGSGVIAGEDAAGIRVDCALHTYTVGGVVSGLLDGDEIVLQMQGGERLGITANGPFVFPAPIGDGSSYAVEVLQAPARPNWTCEVHNSAGLMAGEDVGDVEVACYPQLLLQAVAGTAKVRLDWNTQSFSGARFELCQAREGFDRTDFDRCRQLQEGVLHAAVVTPLVLEGLTNNQDYHFLLQARWSDERGTYSQTVTATPFGGLNDTGIDWCADTLANRLGSGNSGDKLANCEELAASHPGQDAMSGRDRELFSRTLKKTGAGSAGFDFTRVCRSGEAAGEGRCPPNPMPGEGLNNWACNRDNVTGLTWELKEQSGLRAAANTYSWYQPVEAVNGGSAGLKNGGVCQGSACDTLAYLKAVNQEQLCGISDWRLPTRKELLSIVDNGRLKPALEVRQFPEVLSEYYWTASPFADNRQAAWQVYFLYGEASTADKAEARSVRLVSGRTVTFGRENP